MTENKGPDITQDDAPVSNQKVGSLLPPAKIHLFSDDLETLNLFHALGEDWRFGRINMAIRGDNVVQAIEHYSRRKSPTLILIQTEETGADFEEKLASLAEYCDEGTAAIVIGPVNDVQLYRHLTSIGVSDYLVAPLKTEDLVEAVANSLQNIVGAVDSHLMAFLGVKGGVGTTSVAAMAGQILSHHMKQKTLVIDAAGAGSNLWSHFGFTPSGTLIEAARAVVDNDDDALNRLIVKSSDNLHVLNSGTENIMDNPVATQAYEMMLDHFLSTYPNVVADISNSRIQITRLVLSRTNSIGLVTTPRVPDLSQAKLLIKAIREMPGGESKNIQIFVNKSGASKHDIPVNDIKEALGVETITEIPWNADMFGHSENTGEALFSGDAFTKIQNEITPVLGSMTGLSGFEDDMKVQMNNSLLSLFNKLRGGA